MMVDTVRKDKETAGLPERLAGLLPALTPASLSLVESLVLQLAAREGVETWAGGKSRLDRPEEGIPLWLDHLKTESYSPGTIRTYMSSLLALFRDHPNPSRLDLMGWLAGRMGSRSPTAVSTDRKAIRSLYSFLREEGLWPTDPTERLKSIKVPKRMRDAPSLEEVIRLLEYECWKSDDTDKYRAMTQVIATTGLRLTEACSVRKDRIFLQRHELVVIGKGNKEGVVPLVPVAEAVIERYMADHPSDSPYLFPGDTKAGYWSGSSYEKTLSRACAKLGLRHYSPHSLRHFFATYTLQHGAKLEVVSHMLRHASVGTTADIYRHVLTSELHEAAEMAPMAHDVPRLTEGKTVEGEARELPA